MTNYDERIQHLKEEIAKAEQCITELNDGKMDGSKAFMEGIIKKHEKSIQSFKDQQGR